MKLLVIQKYSIPNSNSNIASNRPQGQQSYAANEHYDHFVEKVVQD